MKKAGVTDVAGRGGSRLAGFLLVKGREVHGIERRASLLNTRRADHLYQNPHLQNNHSHLFCGDLSGTSMGRGMVVQRLDTARRHEPLASRGYEVAISLE